jgi:hypothetical protein
MTPGNSRDAAHYLEPSEIVNATGSMSREPNADASISNEEIVVVISKRSERRGTLPFAIRFEECKLGTRAEDL